jgi:hypothetical protein
LYLNPQQIFKGRGARAAFCGPPLIHTYIHTYIYLNPKDRAVSVLKTEKEDSPEMLVTTYETIRYRNPKHRDLRIFIFLRNAALF